MREAISIYGDKEHITSVNTKYVFFKFPDGNEDRIRSRKQDLVNVLEWVHTEMYFYNRMYNETKAIYDVEKEKIDKVRHYYSDEEIHAACLKNRFASIDMGLSNEMNSTKENGIEFQVNLRLQARQVVNIGDCIELHHKLKVQLR